MIATASDEGCAPTTNTNAIITDTSANSDTNANTTDTTNSDTNANTTDTTNSDTNANTTDTTNSDTNANTTDANTIYKLYYSTTGF